MKNTALAELIHYIEHKGELLGQKALLNKAKSLLKKDEQDLIDSYNQGVKKALVYDYEGRDYFKNTFKQ